MAITSTIITDGIAGTIIGTVKLNGTTLIDTLTYDNGVPDVSFVSTSDVTLSITDFLALLQFYIAFNNVIIASIFTPSQNQYTPFNGIASLISNNGTDLFLLIEDLAGENIFNIDCTYPSGTILVGGRSPDTSMSYAEWIYCINTISGFRNFVLNAYNL
jgi:hypothetical protein